MGNDGKTSWVCLFQVRVMKLFKFEASQKTLFMGASLGGLGIIIILSNLNNLSHDQVGLLSINNAQKQLACTELIDLESCANNLNTHAGTLQESLGDFLKQKKRNPQRDKSAITS